MLTEIVCNILLTVVYVNVATGFLFFGDDCITPEKQCPNDNIAFYLYTKDTADKPTKMTVDDPDSIKNAPLIKDAPVKLLMHGYTGDKDYTPNKEIRPAYFQSSLNVNILTIDYGPLVRDGCYPEAVQNVELVGMCASQFLDTFLDLRPDVKIEQIHVIAMSLGAHVASQFSRHLKHGLLPRITGLDAAAPLFYTYIVSDKKYLNKGDAKIIDAIHTDGILKGKYLPYADIDFYINGGLYQPDCEDSSCSHARAAEIYAESINSELGFWGYECSVNTAPFGKCNGENKGNWNVIGEKTDLENHGIFMVETNLHPPFAKGRPPDDKKEDPK